MAVLQVLMAEHASLVSSRSLVYNEAFTRAGMFLQALGMSFVGLSLLGAALGFTRDVLVIAVIVVAFDVLIGIATFRRVADTGREDLWAMQAMNRIRQGYVRVAPGSTPFLTAGTFDDVPSVMGSYGFEDSRRRPPSATSPTASRPRSGWSGWCSRFSAASSPRSSPWPPAARCRRPSSSGSSPPSSCSRCSSDGRWAPPARARRRSACGSPRPGRRRPEPDG